MRDPRTEPVVAVLLMAGMQTLSRMFSWMFFTYFPLDIDRRVLRDYVQQPQVLAECHSPRHPFLWDFHTEGLRDFGWVLGPRSADSGSLGDGSLETETRH